MDASIKKETLDFLKQLAKNNNREWFNENKDLYLSSLENVHDFLRVLIAKTGVFDKSVVGLEPKKCLFRIYRDTRFAKDKTPYKTHFGAWISDDIKDEKAGYYIHIQPGNSFLAGGIWHPESNRLKNVREEISFEPAKFKKIINNKTFKDNFGEIGGDKLITAPKGFAKDDPMMEYLKFKDLVVDHKINDKQLLSKDCATYCAKIFKSMVPFNEFLNKPLSL